MTSTGRLTVMTSDTTDEQMPGPAAARACRRPGCGNPLPAQDRGRTRQFCSTDCARRYHNDARPPAPASVPDASADPLAALDVMIRQAAVLVRAAREQADSLDPAHVRAQVADAEAARRRAEAAAVTAEASRAAAQAETLALAEALDAAREDARAAQTTAAAARDQAAAAAAALEQARREAASQITAAHADAAAQAAAAHAAAAQAIRDRDDAIEATRRAEAATARARQGEADARTEAERARADAARERDALRDQHQAQLDAVAALTGAERARAERAEQMLETERADRRHLTTTLTSNGNGKLPRAASGKAGQP